jgi:acetyl/propionyl-CoA carboxylase alpha subunit
LIARADTRREALARLAEALAQTSVVGVTTNRGFLKWLATNPDVVRGQTFTPLIDEEWHPPAELTAADWSAVAGVVGQVMGDGSQPLGFRLNGRPRLRIQIGTEVRSVEIPADAPTLRWARSGAGSVFVDLEGRALEARLAPAPTVEAAVRLASHAGAAAQSVAAPMPGNVLAVRVAEGDAVEAGQVLVVLEAMKMENTVPAPGAGRVSRVLVVPGQQVQRAETLVELD